MDTVEDLTVGAKLAGAGGGGFLGIIAKDADAADRIRERLTAADKRVQPFAWSLWR
jgi:mevalonate kinase